MITNNLADGYASLEEGTFQEASEIQIQRRTDADLRNRWFYVANLPLFRMNGRALEYGLSGRQTFDAIAGADIQDFSRQILKNGVYLLTPSKTEQLEKLAEDIVWVKASHLRLQKEDDAWSYFLVNTSDINAEKLNEAQRAFAAKAHGSLDSKYDSGQESHDYGETMKMLSGRISQTKFWLPKPNHIKKHIPKGKIVARAGRLFSFGSNSYFDASDRGIDIPCVYLRGVRRQEIPEGDAIKTSELEQIKANLDSGNAFRYNGRLYVPVAGGAKIPSE